MSPKHHLLCEWGGLAANLVFVTRKLQKIPRTIPVAVHAAKSIGDQFGGDFANGPPRECLYIELLH